MPGDLESGVRKQTIDTVLRLKIHHQPGKLASVAAGVASERALLGDITTVALGEDHSVRDITVETDDIAQLERVIARLMSCRGSRPAPLDPGVHVAVTAAVAAAARAEGLAGTLK